MTHRVTLAHVAARVHGLAGTVDRLGATVDRVAANLDQLAALVARGFEDVRRDMNNLRNELRSEMQEGFASLRAVVDGHTVTLADHSHRLDRIERKLDSTITRVDDHDVRIQALEKRRGVR